MATHSIGSIVARASALVIDKYASNHLKDYGIVREKHDEENDEEEKVNIEWYVDHPSKSNYIDSDEDYFPSNLYRTVVECGEQLEVEYLGLQDHFFRGTMASGILIFIMATSARTAIWGPAY